MSTFSLVCLITSLLIYISYVTLIYIKYKPSCLSESYYLLKNGKLFSLWMILVAFLIFPSWVEISPINFLFLSFLSTASLIIVGLSPNYLLEDKKVHTIGACCAAIISIIWNIVTGIYIIPLIMLITVIIVYILKTKNRLLWVENLAFSNIYLSIILS